MCHLLCNPNTGHCSSTLSQCLWRQKTIVLSDCFILCLRSHFLSLSSLLDISFYLVFFEVPSLVTVHHLQPYGESKTSPSRDSEDTAVHLSVTSMEWCFIGLYPFFSSGFSLGEFEIAAWNLNKTSCIFLSSSLKQKW